MQRTMVKAVIDLLEESARLLLQKETLDTPDLERLFKSVKPAKEFAPAVAPCAKKVAAAVADGGGA